MKRPELFPCVFSGQFGRFFFAYKKVPASKENPILVDICIEHENRGVGINSA